MQGCFPKSTGRDGGRARVAGGRGAAERLHDAPRARAQDQEPVLARRSGEVRQRQQGPLLRQRPGVLRRVRHLQQGARPGRARRVAANVLPAAVSASRTSAQRYRSCTAPAHKLYYEHLLRGKTLLWLPAHCCS